MHNTEQAFNTAIGELNCLSPYRPATLDELTALAAARDCIDGLLRSCATELRADVQNAPAWADIAKALGTPSASAARQRYGLRRSRA